MSTDAVTVLRSLEWSGRYSYRTGWPCCPACKGIKPGHGKDERGNLPLHSGHSEGCALRSALGLSVGHGWKV